MRQPFLAACVLIPALTLPATAQQDEALARLVALEAALDETFNADNAYDIVAELDPLIRWPGNEPFQQAIAIVERELREAGFIAESEAGPDDRLIYRIEHRTDNVSAWEPIDALVQIVGRDEPVLNFADNRNMIAINSVATPEGGVEAELVSLIGVPRDQLPQMDLKGKIIMADMPPASLSAIAIEHGAIGVLAYHIPDFNQPELHRDSIPHMGTSFGVPNAVWTVLLSHRARQTLLDERNKGPVTLRVSVKTKRYPGDDQTLIAEVRGSTHPDKRIVFSAHVQEPGANDNASGVACQAEMARTAATLLKDGRINPRRTITFLWGDEIKAIARYLREDEQRTRNIVFGVSLDMVGADTSMTGGTFLIEKLPDPSAIWTRGRDKHSEWGAGRVSEDDFLPHYLNDFMLGRANRRAMQNRPWIINTNPYEGGSDHVPFLRHAVPAVLLWHFTDVYYHTDADRLQNISRNTMKNVGVTALCAAISAATADSEAAQLFAGEVFMGAIHRIEEEITLSAAAIRAGEDPAEQRAIVKAWRDWYTRALDSLESLPVEEDQGHLRAWIRQLSERFREACDKYESELDSAEADAARAKSEGSRP